VESSNLNRRCSSGEEPTDLNDRALGSFFRSASGTDRLAYHPKFVWSEIDDDSFPRLGKTLKLKLSRFKLFRLHVTKSLSKD